MAVQIGAKPDAGFDDPLGMLRDCHRRIENFVRVLCHVAKRPQEGALSAEEASAIQLALEYFRGGGLRHNQDEEESLFPRLQAGGGADTLRELAQLEQQHCEASELHAVVEGLFTRWIAAGSLSAAERESLRVAAEKLQALYAGHIRVEEEIVFPRAATQLDAKAISAMGAEFRNRRS